MQQSQLTVIGCGVFGRAIVNGLLSDGSDEYRLALTHRRPDALKALKQDYPGAVVTSDNKDALVWAAPAGQSHRHIVVIETQPRYTGDVCRDISQAYTEASGGDKQQLVVITVCPGISVAQLESWLPKGTPIVRTMPNTPISVGQGATALFANESTPEDVVVEMRCIFKRISPVVTMIPREELIDAVASVSGSCPAYIFYMLQGITAAGESLGLDAGATRQLVAQSCLGAAKLVQETPGESLSELLGKVCSPGGSTERAIKTLDRFDTSTAVQAAVKEAWLANRAMEALALGSGSNLFFFRNFNIPPTAKEPMDRGRTVLRPYSAADDLMWIKYGKAPQGHLA
ncbi:pyrroline-5-carboxylate reductase dimerization-domain-containing protein [Microdochium bolleyi]|uniref:Pyrroline-5-carboxylate reductase dimerization-domain-containing protein n=1 Tax=Microdochium bolleyi TaxID=196109 RepID=A0A136J931_9PEZI|nr:pyrroline-5-carboxylate reductase dimerization-domain-containing protein [Microdochium bolleyi]